MCISKEVKRNRVSIKLGYDFKLCDKLNRWPYVCDNCKFKYGACHRNKFKYDPKIAQHKADANWLILDYNISLLFFTNFLN